MWVLGIEPRPFARATIALNCRGISPTPSLSHIVTSYSDGQFKTLGSKVLIYPGFRAASL